MRNIKIKKQKYYEKDDIVLEIEDFSNSSKKGDKTYITVGNIKQTLKFLKEKKERIVEELEEEINFNQALLDESDADINKIKISDPDLNASSDIKKI